MDRIRKTAPEGEKGRIKPHDADNLSPEQKPPIFSLQYLDKRYCISSCTKEEKAAFADTLHKLSKLTWAEIKQSHRHGSGYEKIPRHEIKGAIPPHITQDVNFIAFRFNGKAPMVGYRDRTIFHIIWLDRQFSLYKH